MLSFMRFYIVDICPINPQATSVSESQLNLCNLFSQNIPLGSKVIVTGKTQMQTTFRQKFS